MSEPMRVYVGTYAKYNSGNLFGAWLDIADYSDKAEFIEACKELHKTENDPELMFQDWENIPDELISESHIKDKVWELAELSDDDREMWQAYMDDCGDCDFSTAQDNYRGEYSSNAAFAEELAVETGMISSDHPMFCYIDWDHYWNADLRMSFFESKGKYFSNN